MTPEKILEALRVYRERMGVYASYTDCTVVTHFGCYATTSSRLNTAVARIDRENKRLTVAYDALKRALGV